MADQNPLPESGGGGGGPGGIPWLWVGLGVGAVVLFLWYRNRQANAASNALTGPLSGGTTTGGAGTVDPYTGQVIDPFTGQPYTANTTGQPTDITGWITNAEAALTKLGAAPGAVNQAIYDYTNGNQLTDTEAGLINKALGAVGYPPINLPFFGTVPTTGPTKKPAPVPTGGGGGAKLSPLASLPAALHLLPGESIVGSIRDAAAGASAGYYFSNLGGIFAVGGAPFRGSYLGLPAAGRQGSRTFGPGGLQLTPGGYELTSVAGQNYSFPAGAKVYT